MPKTIQQLENQLKWAKKQTAFAWAKYYEEINSSHIDDVHQYNQIQVFIVEFKNMIKELKKK